MSFPSEIRPALPASRDRQPEPLGLDRPASKASSDQAVAELEELIASLQAAEESNKAMLARELHDDLGGLMMAAMMDLGTVQSLGPAMPPQARERLLRIKKTLEAAIDLKRQITERLRPSILDNFGLFAALRWHVKEHCGHAGASCTEHYPAIEPALGSAASLAFFPDCPGSPGDDTLKRSMVRNSSLHVSTAGGNILMTISDDGTPTLHNGEEIGGRVALVSMQHRIRVLGGSVDIERTADGRTVLTASMPLSAERASI